MRRQQVVYPEDSQIAKELHFLHTKKSGDWAYWENMTKDRDASD